MIQIDLITGFLGSGKTTFIKKYASFFMSQGKRIGILENDHGAVNVDMMMLQDLQGARCELEMVSGGCDADCHKRRFKTKLIAMGMSGYDRVLIEPSGVFDMDEFFDTLYEEPLCRWYEIGNVIAIVDAGLEDDLSKQADYLLASQVANAGKIVLSRVQETGHADIQQTISHIQHALEQVHCQRNIVNAFCTFDWEQMTEAEWNTIASCGYVAEDYEKLPSAGKDVFDSLCFLEMKINDKNIQNIVASIMDNPSCGHVFRIKGFFKTENGAWMELNATRTHLHISPIDQGQEVMIVIGEGLEKQAIENFFR